MSVLCFDGLQVLLMPCGGGLGICFGFVVDGLVYFGVIIFRLQGGMVCHSCARFVHFGWVLWVLCCTLKLWYKLGGLFVFFVVLWIKVMYEPGSVFELWWYGIVFCVLV